MKFWQLCAILQPIWLIAQIQTNVPGTKIMCFAMFVIVTLCGIFSFKADPRP